MADELTADIQQLSSTDAEAKPSLFELKPTEGKGLGLFATSSIARGTRIIEEAPLVVVPPGFGDALQRAHLWEEVKRFTPDRKKAFFALCPSPSAGSIPEALGPPAQNNVDPSADQNTRTEVLAAFPIFATNSITMGERGTGVFALYSRINHSCTPNVHASWNETLGKLTAQATREINKNEEILTTYVDVYKSCEDRNADLSTWGFRCRCRCCGAGPKAAASDIWRKEIFRTGNELAPSAQALISCPGITIEGNFHVALKEAERILKLYRVEGITGVRLSGLYLQLSLFSLACGATKKAVKYAKMNLDVERYCIGTDTAYPLENGLKGPEFWYQYMTNEHAKLQKNVAGLTAGKDKDKDKAELADDAVLADDAALAEDAASADDAALGDDAALTGEGSGTGKGKGMKDSSAVVEKAVFGQSSDPTSSPVEQCAPSPKSPHEQAADVDSNLDLPDDLPGALVASMGVDDELGDDDELEDDGELENDASFARASAAAQGAHIRFNETANIQNNLAAPEASDSAADKGDGNGRGKDKRKRKLKRNRKGKGNREPILDQFPDPSSKPVERPPSSSGSHHEQATDVDPHPHPDGARVASTDDDNEAGWTKIEESGTGKWKGKGKVKKA